MSSLSHLLSRAAIRGHYHRDTMRMRRAVALAGAIAIVVSVLGSGQVSAVEITSIDALPANTHIHGLAVDRAYPSYLLIATHHGLFRVASDGKAELVSVVQDFMGFNPHPSDPNTLYASGHPAAGGNLGFITSDDHGKTWVQVSPGLNGPVDFHQMSVSPADPNTIYGNYGDIQVSRDGGKSWDIVGPAPEKLIDLAASATDKDTLYAATELGLFASSDAGKTWKPLLEGAPVTVVDVTPDGVIHAFVIGKGLLQSREDPLEWKTLSTDWGEQYLLHIAVDPADANRIYAATGQSQVLASKDGGANWTALGQ